MKINDLLIELNMTPKRLKTKAAGIDALIGMEFEMYVPGAAVPDENDLEMVPDMDQNTRPYDIGDILTFYSRGDNPMGRNELDRLKVRLQNEYDEYITQEIDNFWRDEGYEYFKENFDADDLDEGETVEDVWEEQGRQYWAIHSRFVEEQREDPPSERDWLRDRDWTSMEDINDHFGFTWPYWKQEEPEEVQWEMDDIAESFSVSVGRGVSVEGNGGNGEYGLTTDGSLKAPNDPTDAGLEFISPPLTIDEMVSDLYKVRKWAKSHGCYTSEETGLHINVSIRGANWGNLDYVKLALLLGDQYVLDKFGRLENTYAASALEKIEKVVRDNPDTAFHMMATMKQHMDAYASRILHDLATQKYTSINLKLNFDADKKRVEFRSPGGDYLGKNFDYIKDTMLRFVVALDSALNPEKDRKEYIKKLYKMLRPHAMAGAGFDITKYFAEFSAGELDVQELKSALHLFRPNSASMRPQLPKSVQPEKPAAGSDIKKPETSASTRLNTYLNNVANTMVTLSTDERLNLIRELVTVMADRKGYPEWDTAVPAAKRVIQRSGVDASIVTNAVRAVNSGSRLTTFA